MKQAKKATVNQEIKKRSSLHDFEGDMRQSWTTFSRYGTWREVQAHNEAVLKKHGWTLDEFFEALGLDETGY